MTTSYSDWQQSVDGPDEETPEDRNSGMMGDILDGYKPSEAAELLGVSVSTVYRIRRTGIASAKTLDAMRQVWDGLGWE
jgi:hypothetical protein